MNKMIKPLFLIVTITVCISSGIKKIDHKKQVLFSIKKYCLPIIKKVDVDFLILTRFDKKFDVLNKDRMEWGYELRILNTKTLKQKNTINAHGLGNYQEILKHIHSNISKLKTEIEDFQ